MCLEYHIVRVNSQNPLKLVHSQTFTTTTVGFFIGKDTQAREGEVFLQYSAIIFLMHSIVNQHIPEVTVFSILKVLFLDSYCTMCVLKRMYMYVSENQ